MSQYPNSRTLFSSCKNQTADIHTAFQHNARNRAGEMSCPCRWNSQ